MNRTQFDFIKKVSDIVARYSQFPNNLCDLIGCQFALESSYGESPLAHSNHNYCGMKNPLVRISSALHAGDALYYWAQYDDLATCIVDYLLCLQYHRPMSTNYDTIPHFAAFISKFYCPEKDYIDKINLIYQHFKSLKNEYSK